MLGWNIGVFKQTDGGLLPGRVDSALGERLAVWQTGVRGLDWLSELVEAGDAIDLGGDGYPLRYTAQAQVLTAPIVDGPPEAHTVWVYERGDILGDAWAGKAVIDHSVLDGCESTEWLLVEAWDES